MRRDHVTPQRSAMDGGSSESYKRSLQVQDSVWMARLTSTWCLGHVLVRQEAKVGFSILLFLKHQKRAVSFRFCALDSAVRLEGIEHQGWPCIRASRECIFNRKMNCGSREHAHLSDNLLPVTLLCLAPGPLLQQHHLLARSRRSLTHSPEKVQGQISPTPRHSHKGRQKSRQLLSLPDDALLRKLPSSTHVCFLRKLRETEQLLLSTEKKFP